MFEMKDEMNSISFVFSSDMGLVDRVILECERHFKRRGSSASFELRLVLRELLINAVEHGNHKLCERKVTCQVDSRKGNRFRLVVEDEGCGFDFKSLDMSMPENPLQIRNRGYAMISHFSDYLEFNDAGNRITAYVDKAK